MKLSLISLSLVAGLVLCGFSLSPALVPRDKIVSGGPPKDGIPALTRPNVESAQEAARWLEADDMVLGIVMQGHARAYPLRVMNWHEIVNDQIAGRKFVVTYCPLCASGLAFDSSDEFGVSGLLYQSDVLLYDRKTETLWSQLKMQAVAGPRTGESLKTLPLTHTTWRAWRRMHPETTVLSRNTGYRRDYDRNPYAGYARGNELYFDVAHHDGRLPAKARVIGLTAAGAARAWPINVIRREKDISDSFAGRTIRLRWQDERVVITDAASKKELHGVVLYWFAWAAFHPRTTLYPPASD